MTSASSLSSRRPAAIGEIGETDGLCGRHGAAGASFAGLRPSSNAAVAGAPATFLSRGQGALSVPSTWLRRRRGRDVHQVERVNSEVSGSTGALPLTNPDCDRLVIAIASSSPGATATERR